MKKLLLLMFCFLFLNCGVTGDIEIKYKNGNKYNCKQGHISVTNDGIFIICNEDESTIMNKNIKEIRIREIK